MLGCIADVEVWCRYRGLKLNADKSEVLWLGTRQQVAKLSPADKDLDLPTGSLSASSNARHLGVTVDRHSTCMLELAPEHAFTTSSASDKFADSSMSRRRDN